VDKKDFHFMVYAFVAGVCLVSIVGLIVSATGAGRGNRHSQPAAGVLQRGPDTEGLRPDRALLSGLEARRNDNDRLLREAVERIQSAIDGNDEPIQQIGATLTAVSDFLHGFNDWMDANNDIADNFHHYINNARTIP
jgi:ABC-type transporter Mla subunit MlaD